MRDTEGVFSTELDASNLGWSQANPYALSSIAVPEVPGDWATPRRQGGSIVQPIPIGVREELDLDETEDCEIHGDAEKRFDLQVWRRVTTSRGPIIDSLLPRRKMNVGNVGDAPRQSSHNDRVRIHYS